MTTVLIIAGIVLLLGLVGLGVWWALRKKKLENGFKMDYDITVYLSPQTLYLKPAETKRWTDDLVQHWHETMGWDLEAIRRSLAGLQVFMVDKESIKYEGDGNPETTELAAGLDYLQEKRIYITTLRKGQTTVNKHRVWALWRHEVSHLPVVFIGKLWTNKESHALFAETKLGA